MQFNVVVYILALVAVVHGAAIGVRSPMWAQIAKPKPGDPASAAAPSGGVAASTAPKQWSCRCGGIKYDSSQVYSTVAHANPLADNSVGPATDTPNKKFPHRFNNDEKLSFPLCTGESLTEFPLKKSGNYAGEAAKGADRVLYVKGTGKFCGCLHHVTDTDFEKCTLE